MRKPLLLTALLLWASVFGLCAAPQLDPALIAGTWNREKSGNELMLYRITNGRLEPFISYNLQANDDRFAFAFYPEGDGFYVLGSGPYASGQHKYLFYFKPGDKLELAVNDSTYVLTGNKNTAENKEMARWHDYTAMLEYKSVYFSSRFGAINRMTSTYVDFFPFFEDFLTKAKSYQSKTGNKAFDTRFARIREYDVLRYACAFVSTPRTAHPEKEDYIAYYRDMNVPKLTATAELHRYPFGSHMLSNLIYIQDKFDPNAPGPGEGPTTLESQMKRAVENRDRTLALITNDTLKGEWVINGARSIKTYEEYQLYDAKYGQYLRTPDQQARMSERVAALLKSTQEQKELKTIDFSGTDLNDKKVSLSDFKGKVVVVDVWATWCGPCKKEIPALKAMEEAYHDKDVVFLSISVDNLKDKQKWIDYVKKEELKGVQLFGGKGWESDVATFYGIKGIPRFMVYGKDGKIVTNDAPRPSDPALKAMVDKLLAK